MNDKVGMMVGMMAIQTSMVTESNHRSHTNYNLSYFLLSFQTSCKNGIINVYQIATFGPLGKTSHATLTHDLVYYTILTSRILYIHISILSKTSVNRHIVHIQQ